MGTLTRTQLLEQAGLAAGNDQAASFVRVWLNAWLQRTAKSWSWPCLKRSVSNIAVAAGDIGVVIEPADVGGHQVHKVLNGVVFWRAQSGYIPNGRMFVRPLAETDPALYEANLDPGGARGTPSTVKVRVAATSTPGESGNITLLFNCPVDRDIYISFDAHLVPMNIVTTELGDAQTPWYPNDRTLIQACKVALLELDTAGERSDHYDGENLKLGAMVADDRDFDGEQAGDNQMMTLDPSVFR